MKTTQHTPGKWIVALSSHEDAEFIVGIAEPDPRGEGYNPEIALVRNSKAAKANARLIAAAPELLEACRAFVQAENEARARNPLCPEVQPEHPIQLAWLQARAAIAKAQGKE